MEENRPTEISTAKDHQGVFLCRLRLLTGPGRRLALAIQQQFGRRGSREGLALRQFLPFGFTHRISAPIVAGRDRRRQTLLRRRAIHPRSTADGADLGRAATEHEHSDLARACELDATRNAGATIRA